MVVFEEFESFWEGDHTTTIMAAWWLVPFPDKKLRRSTFPLTPRGLTVDVPSPLVFFMLTHASDLPQVVAFVRTSRGVRSCQSGVE
jgi:hypothetical protein